jgi:hypothetical protein
MLRHVVLLRTDVSEELITSMIRVTRIDELGTTSHVLFLRSVLRLLVTANGVGRSPILVTLMMEAISSDETSGLTRFTRHNILENGILHSHRRVNVKPDIALTCWALRRSNVCTVGHELGFNIPEDGIPHCLRRENRKSYKCSCSIYLFMLNIFTFL